MESIMESVQVETVVESTPTTKKCSKCGRELPLEAFNRCTSTKDGLQYYCKDCSRAANKLGQARRDAMKAKDIDGKVPSHLTKVYSNPELARFTPRQLMEELKARGFKWEYMLEPQKKIFYEKI